MRLFYVLLLSLCFFSPLSWSEAALDLPALQQFFNAGKVLESATKKYPALNDSGEDFLLSGDSQKLITRMKEVGALEDVTSILKKNGYSSVGEYFNTTKRIMAAFFAVQLEESPEYSSAQDMRDMVSRQRKELEKNGISEEMIQQLMKGVNEQLEQLDQLFELAETARPADVKAVKENLDYVMKMMDSNAEE